MLDAPKTPSENLKSLAKPTDSLVKLWLNEDGMIVSNATSEAEISRRRGPRALARAARVRVDMAALEGLRLLFGFDRWHARSPDSARPYREQLAALANGLQPARVVEVGCGLGGILSRIKAKYRHGYDQDPAVIRAARLLHGRSVRFDVGGFDEVPGRGVDLLIAVNWIHEAPPEQLERWIGRLLPFTHYLLVDAILPGTPGYAHHHDFRFLDGRATHVSIIADSEPSRRFLLWEVAGRS